MKEYFKQLMSDLKSLRGINQYEEMKSKPNGAEELQKLYEAVRAVWNSFSYIPDSVKEYTIRQRIIDDPEFYNLNSAVVYKWLNNISGKYWNHTEEYTQEQSNAKEVSPQTQAMIQKFMNDLLENSRFQYIEPVTERELKDLKEDDERKYPKALSKNLQSTTREEMEMFEKKIEWARECTHLHTGELLPNKPTFQEWLKQN